MLNDPLHDPKVVQHLNEGDEENDGTQNTGEEPVFGDYGVLVKEENCTDVGLLQEIRGKESKPLENLEASIRLENEKGDSLLEEETNDDCLPTSKFEPLRSHG